MDGLRLLKVYNRCSYDVGVKLSSGMQPIIQAGSFLPMTVNDILYLESISRNKKPFSSKELVPVDDDGKELTLEELGGYTDSYVAKHYDKEEISANLRKSVKQIEKWLEEINDPIELASIIEVAKAQDLPTSKMKVLRDKAPNADVFDE